MKIAICLSGQPRWFKECHEYIQKNIIENFSNVDVFIHAWNPPKDLKYESSIKSVNTGEIDLNLKKEISDLYKPVKLEINDPIQFKEANFYPYSVPKNWPPNNVFSMFYSIKKCISFKKENENLTGVDYDWVFRSRFDYAINRRFTKELLDQLKNDTFYSPHVVRSGNVHCHGDFNFGSSKVMDCLGRTFDNIMTYGENSTMLACESMTYRQIIEEGYKIEEFDLMNQFPPSKNSSCWHSLWGHR